MTPPCAYHVRPDGSIYIVFGDVAKGPHCQANCDLPESYVKLLVGAYNTLHAQPAPDLCHRLREISPACDDDVHRQAADAIEAARETIRQLTNEVSDLTGLITAYRKWASECPILEKERRP